MAASHALAGLALLACVVVQVFMGAFIFSELVQLMLSTVLLLSTVIFCYPQ